MTKQELREKIADTLNATEISVELEKRDIYKFADSLIADGIGDVEEWKSRTDFAEKQVYCLARMFAEALCKNGNPENLISGFVEDAKKQAEKELREEKKDE